MSPVVLIAMYGRKPLVEINLRLLEKENCEVVVITSNDSDHNFVRGLGLKNVHICTAPNQPLGTKWQLGVDYCREIGADSLIILGSDDFLSAGFVSKACEVNKDFTFFTEWFIHDLTNKKDYRLKYKNLFPLGSGRVFSKQFLDRRDWNIFDRTRERLLDDYAFDTLKSHDDLVINPQGMKLLAVKGNWDTMNPLDKILIAETIDWKFENQLSEQIGFDVKQTFSKL